MALYGIFSFLDYAIYSIVKFVVRLIILIANANFFDDTVISEVARKVYVILGVLVLFKIVISCVQYMVNPDTFDDKDKGMVGILKKAVISMVLLALIQPAFSIIMEMQTMVVSTIPSIVLGNSTQEASEIVNAVKLGGSTENEKKANSEAFRKALDEISDQVAGTTIWSFVTKKDNDSYKKANGNRSIPSNDGGVDIADGSTVEEFHERITKGCDGSIWALFDTNRCYFDYRIGISTVAGCFLLYVLISMCLDVGIRTIKMGILQILAPIPISSYIVSKDKLSKYFKLVGKVYADLFIRLAIIYFIIFFVQKVVNSLDNSANKIIANGSYIPDSVETAFIKVIIVIALFMFAKNAPKFISEVLGIDGGGFSDVADMFKPGRLTGLAGAAINPARNAISNVRDAWKNNADMVDNRGGKIRRAFQKMRRVENAALHGFGGAAKGVTDGALGLVAGDNWSKMNERHRKAIAVSKRRSAEAFMKRTDNDTRQEFKDKREQIEKEFKEQGIDINKRMRNIRSDATKTVYDRLDGYNSQISDLQHKIAEGKLNGASSDQIKQWNDDLQTAIANRNRLSTKAGFDAEVEKEVQNNKKALVQNAIQAKTQTIRNKLNDNNQRMSTIMTKLADPTISASERATAETTYAQLLNESEQLRTQLSADGLKAMEKQYMDNLNEQIDIKTERLDKQRGISGSSILKGKVDQFFGGEGFTGKGYIDVANILKDNRGSLWSGEAMTKLQQNPHILQVNGIENKYGAKSSIVGYDVVEFERDSSGKPIVDTVTGKFKVKVDGSGKPIKREFTYSEILDFKQQIATGQIKPDQIEAVTGFKNATDLEAVFKDVEKSAASDYVTMSVEGKIANSTITESISRMKASIAASNIPKAEKNKLLAELEADPGSFLKKASDVQEHLRTKGSRISAYNSGKKDG